MNHKIKLFIIYFVSFFALFIGSQSLLAYFFPELDHLYKLLIAAVFTIIFCPRVQKVQTKNGIRYQLKWLFRKEPLIK